MNIDFNAPPTVSDFLDSNAFVRVIVGPVGSGKSSGSVMEILRRAMEQAPGPDGFRRSRWAVVRNTYRQLKDTTRKTFEQWLPSPQLGEWRESDFAFDLWFNDVRAEILFRALDRPEDVGKLLSLELTGAYVNEVREVPKGVIDALTARVGRYPAMRDGGPTWSGIWCDTNPWWAGHWGSKLEAEGHEDFAFFRQPGGRSPDAENVENLPPRYYEQISVGKDAEWIRVYVDGEDAAGDIGSVYGTWLTALQKWGRVCAFDHPKDGVFTTWDLGRSDATAIWFWRLNRHGVPDVIDWYEASGQGLGHFFGVVDGKGYQYAQHWLPPDAKAKTLATQVSVLDQAMAHWPGKVSIVPRLSVSDGIAAARWLLEQPMQFHERCETPCELGHSGLDALRAYRFDWDEEARVYSREPVHDFASHSADAFRYLALVVKFAELVTRKPEPENSAPPHARSTVDQLFKRHQAGLRNRKERI